MTQHQIFESEVYREMIDGLTADMAWPLALETVLRKHGVRFTATGAVLRKIELTPPYEVWHDMASQSWTVVQP